MRVLITDFFFKEFSCSLSFVRIFSDFSPHLDHFLLFTIVVVVFLYSLLYLFCFYATSTEAVLVGARDMERGWGRARG